MRLRTYRYMHEKMEKMEPLLYDVIVVGGGISGLSAAARLKQFNVKSLVIEAASIMGGRMRTHQDTNLELGAQWIHGGVNANSLYNYAIQKGVLNKENKIQEDSEKGIYFYTSTGRMIDLETSQKAWEIHERIVDEAENYPKGGNGVQISLRSYYEKQAKEKLKELRQVAKNKYVSGEYESDLDYNEEDLKLAMDALIIQFEAYCGDTLDDAGVAVYGTSQELPGGDIIFPAGTTSVIRELEKEIDERVMNTKVTRIERKEDSIIISTEERPEAYRAKHVILTVPLGVLQKKSIAIEPPLGAPKETAIANLRPGRISKVFLHFNEPFWIPGEGDIIFLWTKEEMEQGVKNKDWTTRVSSIHELEGCPNWMVMWVSGEAAVIVDSIDDEQVLKGATRILRRFTGDPGISVPDKILRHPWLADPLALGTWSYPSVNTKHQDYYELMRAMPSPENPRLLLAGEHVHPQYWSFMHGARLSGIEQADKIIKYMEKMKPKQNGN